MRELWIKVNPLLSTNEKKELVKSTSAFCSAYIVDPIDEMLVRKTGAKTIISPQNGDILLVNTIEEILKAKEHQKVTCIIATISSKKDEKKIVKAIDALVDYVAIKCPDWKVIPLENLIARVQEKSSLFAWVSNVQDAKLALEALEIGVDGVVAELSEVTEIERIHQELKKVKTRTVERKPLNV